ncbi:hypothetical protein Bhyg_06126 [Pseudolycoriella hygida]|uniref:Uncharacterized protein n=1 Tax=Pseudolycoriella hygida TaxID=35572 RepID=A0A9Q0N0V0_9DIPT|nr:hypothetical protein Bhyg_06126 [Pseudolycoriella hygida]
MKRFDDEYVGVDGLFSGLADEHVGKDGLREWCKFVDEDIPRSALACTDSAEVFSSEDSVLVGLNSEQAGDDGLCVVLSCKDSGEGEYVRNTDVCLKSGLAGDGGGVGIHSGLKKESGDDADDDMDLLALAIESRLGHVRWPNDFKMYKKNVQMVNEMFLPHSCVELEAGGELFFGNLLVKASRFEKCEAIFVLQGVCVYDVEGTEYKPDGPIDSE